jgi:hypothetical protein
MSNLAFDFNHVISGISERLGVANQRKGGRAAEPLFEKLTHERQQAALERSRRQLLLMEMETPETQEFEKLDVLCQYYGLRPVSDEIYGRLTGDIAWEIVDFELNQLYRNKLIFQLGNYSVEEYETYSPWDLFRRPASILGELQKMTGTLLQAESLLSLKHIPAYIIEEALSPERAQFELMHEFACPLVNRTTRQNQAFVSAFRFRALPADGRVALFH